MNRLTRRACRLDAATVRTLVERAQEVAIAVGDLAGEEREKVDNAPESLQDTERTRAFEEAADALDEVASDLDDAIALLEAVATRLDELGGTSTNQP